MLRFLASRKVRVPAISILFAACIWLSSPPSAPAAPITFAYTGEVTSVRDDGPYLDGSITVGTPFWGTYTFESSTPDDYPNVPWARYTFPASAQLIMTLHVGSYSLVAPIAYIGVDNGAKDTYGVSSRPFNFSTKQALSGFAYTDLSGTVFESDSLPLEPPDIARFNDFGSFRFASTDQVGDSFSVDGRVLTITPEPEAALLALVSLSLSVRRRIRF